MKLHRSSEWSNWLEDVFRHLSPNVCAVQGLYEVATIIVEEVGRTTLLPTQRVNYDHFMQTGAKTVANHIQNSLVGADVQDVELASALRCLIAWLDSHHVDNTTLEACYYAILNRFAEQRVLVESANALEEFLSLYSSSRGFLTGQKAEPLLDLCSSDWFIHIFDNAIHGKS